PKALQLLARAAARTGRDGLANTLFARLGESSFEAEDYFLLGLGLSRSGQGDSAVGVWEKALASDADHAEAIEQLAQSYTARNRLVEAASLYERLAKRPGREMRSELSLGALRAELNDPAGATQILAQALRRQDVDLVPPAVLAPYRKLMARNL